MHNEIWQWGLWMPTLKVDPSEGPNYFEGRVLYGFTVKQGSD